MPKQHFTSSHHAPAVALEPRKYAGSQPSWKPGASFYASKVADRIFTRTGCSIGGCDIATIPSVLVSGWILSRTNGKHTQAPAASSYGEPEWPIKSWIFLLWM